MLCMMDFHRDSVDVGLQCVVSVVQFREFVCHDIYAVVKVEIYTSVK